MASTSNDSGNGVGGFEPGIGGLFAQVFAMLLQAISMAGFLLRAGCRFCVWPLIACITLPYFTAGSINIVGAVVLIALVILLVLVFIVGYVVAWAILALDQSENVIAWGVVSLLGSAVGLRKGDFSTWVRVEVCPLLPFGGQIPILRVGICDGRKETKKQIKSSRATPPPSSASFLELGMGSEAEWQAIVAHGKKISALADDVHDMASQWEEVRDQLRMYGTGDLWMPTPMQELEPGTRPHGNKNGYTNTTPRLALLDSLDALSSNLGTCATLLPELPAHLVALVVKVRITVKQAHAAALQLNRRRPDDARELTRQYTIQVDAILQYLDSVVGIINKILVADEEAKKILNVVWYHVTGCETWLDEQVQDRLNSLQLGSWARWTKGTLVATRNKSEQEQWENLQRAKLIQQSSVETLQDLRKALKNVRGSVQGLRNVLDRPISMNGRDSWALQVYLGGLDAQLSFFNELQRQLQEETG
ncbi:hypothetical protein BKA61DRAFT_574462 [Leptodontidium sp. MPI-SDFR-AT-0119]|nr:hypothetical protein BKA61DRAFT_574462 [Leptodontidium sp. MPI-SDFR-AT-0119]